jgi:6-pyruvoyltetrahydropterin/6-carboxytetrahydropterin synthase
MLYITRKVEFCASHRLCNPAFTDEENFATYGQCASVNGHGHNYTLEVTIKGQPSPETGMIMDLKDLKKLIEREIMERVDHKNLNVDVPFLEGVIPTTENLCICFWDLLAPHLPRGCESHELRLWETDNNLAFYRGEGATVTRHLAAHASAASKR